MINWEVGKAYKMRNGEKYVCHERSQGSTYSYPVRGRENGNGQYLTFTEDGKFLKGAEHEHDIVGEWDEPKQTAIKCKHRNITPDHQLQIYACDDCDCIAEFDSCGTADIHGDHEPDEVRAAMLVPDCGTFDYKSPPANKTYIVPLPEKVIAEMKKYDDLRKATTREMAKALCIPKELMVEPPGMISDVKLYRKAMFCGPLNEQKAPPTITNENWEGMCEKLLGKGSVTVGNALMIDRDNKTDDRRPFKMFRNPHYKRDVAAANLSLYRHKHSIWPHVVAERAADKPENNREVRPWHERV